MWNVETNFNVTLTLSVLFFYDSGLDDVNTGDDRNDIKRWHTEDHCSEISSQKRDVFQTNYFANTVFRTLDNMKYSFKTGHLKYLTSSTVWNISQLIKNDIIPELQNTKHWLSEWLKVEGGPREMKMCELEVNPAKRGRGRKLAI